MGVLRQSTRSPETDIDVSKGLVRLRAVSEERDSSPSEPIIRRRPRPPVDLPQEPGARRAVPYVLAIAFAAILGLSSESIRAVEGVVAGAAFPVAMLYLGIRPLRTKAPASLWRTALAIALLTGLASEYFLYREYFPPKALAQTSVSTSSPDITVALPDAYRRFEVMVHGKLKGDEGNAEARYTVELRRGDRTDRLDGEMSRHQGSAPRRSISMTKATGSTSIETGRHEVELDAPGSVAVHLAYLGNGAQKGLSVSFYPRALSEKAVAILFGILVGGAWIAQALAGRRGIVARMSATTAIAGVYTLYLQRYLDPDDTLLTVLPAMVVSFVMGGVSGLVLGWLAGLLPALRPRS